MFSQSCFQFQFSTISILYLNFRVFHFNFDQALSKALGKINVFSIAYFFF